MYLITSLLFVAGTIIEFAFVLLFKRAFEQESLTLRDANENKTNIQISTINVGDGMCPPDGQEFRAIQKGLQHQERGMVYQSTKMINFKITTNMIDFAAFSIFFLS